MYYFTYLNQSISSLSSSSSNRGGGDSLRLRGVVELAVAGVVFDLKN